MDKQFVAENPLTLTLKGKDFLDFGYLTEKFSSLQVTDASKLWRRSGWGKEKYRLVCLSIIHVKYTPNFTHDYTQ